jgi:putative redox protein
LLSSFYTIFITKIIKIIIMDEQVITRWVDGMAFESEVGDYKIIVDASEEFGGMNRGPRPKALLLTALGGCTGMDVIAILGKMRIYPASFRVEVSAETKKDHPKIYEKIHIRYIFKGRDLPYDKLETAVSYSRERYCAVNAMLGKSALMSVEIITED